MFEKTLEETVHKCYYQKAVLSADDTHRTCLEMCSQEVEMRDFNNSIDVRNEN